MIRRDIAVINQSSVIDDTEGAALTKALATQIHRDFAPAWGTDARLRYVPRGAKPPDGLWWLMLMDDSDEAGALGYHDLTPQGLPIGKVFARTDKRYGLSTGVTLSHEATEMLGDPYINLVVQLQDNAGNVTAIAYETADAVEADKYGYEVAGQQMSNFVFPRFFDPTAPQDGTVQLDQCHHVSKPFEILPGGYLSKWTPSGGWTQMHGAPPAPGDRPRVGSRRERRTTPRQQWLTSDPLDWQSGDPLARCEVGYEDIDPEV